MKPFVNFCMCHTASLLVLWQVKKHFLPGPMRPDPKMLSLSSQVAHDLQLGPVAALDHELSSDVCEIKFANRAQRGFGLFQMFTRVWGRADLRSQRKENGWCLYTVVEVTRFMISVIMIQRASFLADISVSKQIQMTSEGFSFEGMEYSGSSSCEALGFQRYSESCVVLKNLQLSFHGGNFDTSFYWTDRLGWRNTHLGGSSSSGESISALPFVI